MTSHVLQTWWLARHGQTELNRDSRVQGWSDAPLTPVGLVQANALRAQLMDTPLDAVVSSTLLRAVTTARLAAGGRGLPITFDGAWREMHFGRYEAGPESALVAAGFEGILDDVLRGTEGGFPHGETMREYRARVTEGCMRIARGPHRHILVVSHGVTLWLVLSMLLGDSPPHFGNGELRRLDVTDTHLTRLTP